MKQLFSGSYWYLKIGAKWIENLHKWQVNFIVIFLYIVRKKEIRIISQCKPGIFARTFPGITAWQQKATSWRHICCVVTSQKWIDIVFSLKRKLCNTSICWSPNKHYTFIFKEIHLHACALCAKKPIN